MGTRSVRVGPSRILFPHNVFTAPSPPYVLTPCVRVCVWAYAQSAVRVKGSFIVCVCVCDVCYTQVPFSVEAGCGRTIRFFDALLFYTSALFGRSLPGINHFHALFCCFYFYPHSYN